MRVPLSLETLPKLDAGRVAIAFEQAVAACVRDCADRPGDKSARRVTLTLELKPEAGESGVCEAVHADFKVATKVPDRRSRLYEFALHPKGALVFNDESPDDARQGTFGDVVPASNEGGAS